MSEFAPRPHRQWQKPPYSWDEAETTDLIGRYQSGDSLDDLAAHFDRSPHHIVVQLAWVMCGVGADQLNPLAPRFREPWGDDEHRLLETQYRAGRHLTEIAGELGRDVTDVAWRLITERMCDRWLSPAG